MEQTQPQNTNGNSEHQLEVSEFIAPTQEGGRPTKYEPKMVARILASIADGLTIRQACIASGICENTLATWRKTYPRLELCFTEAREQARQKALAGIKTAGESGDWRAWEAYLKLSFQEYRQNSKV